MGYQGKYCKEFAEQVLQKIDKPIEAMAMLLNVPPKTWWNWKNAIFPFGIDLLSRLYLVTKFKEVFDFHLRPCGLIVVENNESARKDYSTGNLLEKIIVHLSRGIETYRFKDKNAHHEFTEVIRLLKGFQEKIKKGA